MNRQKLIQLGVPEECCADAIEGVRLVASQNTDGVDKASLSLVISEVLDEPDHYVNDKFWSKLAKSVIEERDFIKPDPAPYQVWGEDIEAGAISQMEQAVQLPMAVRGAMMADSHQGYGLNIGGVLALDNAVVPYAVGVDISCMVKVSVLDLPVNLFEKQNDRLCKAVERSTLFGTGPSGCYEGKEKHNHDVLDDDRWQDTKLLKSLKDGAHNQLGTSGSGNHFCDMGILTIDSENELGLSAGQYVAVLTHSGSRGAGYKVCQKYSKIAESKLPKRWRDFVRFAWLDMDSEDGQEYWMSMNLMADFASANHACIHKRLAKNLGAKVLTSVENSHNLAWKETHENKEVIVHRKGATPAGKGVLGVIPGSMGTPAYVVRGLGSVDSMDSASHGAGRVMSRTKAKDTFAYGDEIRRLAAQGVRVLSAGADEVPGVYKKIDEVMAYQQDLVEAISRFDPKVVKMCGDGSKAED